MDYLNDTVLSSAGVLLTDFPGHSLIDAILVHEP